LQSGNLAGAKAAFEKLADTFGKPDPQAQAAISAYGSNSGDVKTVLNIVPPPISTGGLISPQGPPTVQGPPKEPPVFKAPPSVPPGAKHPPAEPPITPPISTAPLPEPPVGRLPPVKEPPVKEPPVAKFPPPEPPIERPPSTSFGSGAAGGPARVLNLGGASSTGTSETR
jgi:hypothetical protein